MHTHTHTRQESCVASDNIDWDDWEMLKDVAELSRKNTNDKRGGKWMDAVRPDVPQQ